MLSPIELPTLTSLLTIEGAPYINRDLSWLDFNYRVLGEANDQDNPLLERLKFLAISASNLDEFFMIRFASLIRSQKKAGNVRATELLTRLNRIRKQIVHGSLDFQVAQGQALAKISEALLPFKIIIHTRESLSQELASTLIDSIQDKLDTLEIFDKFKKSHLYAVKNLQTLALLSNGKLLRIPAIFLPVHVHVDEVSGSVHLVFNEHLLSSFLTQKYSLKEPPLFLRLTRDADVSFNIEEGVENDFVPDHVRSKIGDREKRTVVRIQSSRPLTPEMKAILLSTLRVEEDQLFSPPHPLQINGLWTALKAIPESFRSSSKLVHPDLWSVIPDRFAKTKDHFGIFSNRDFLLHHPYDSFDTFVTWLSEAAMDPLVQEIDITIYRTDPHLTLVKILEKASRLGKKVLVLIELRARFDELNNLKLAERLQKSGVKVVFGSGTLKIHAKIAVISRLENGALKHYTHLSTGNYHSFTAKQYTDLAILTGNQEMGKDAKVFFKAVEHGKIPSGFKHLVSAPTGLQRRLKSLITNEIKAAKAKKPAHIFVKVNSLVDSSIIDSLYLASQAGVQVDLIVRGACSLIPGVKGLSENIRVISIVDRFLEHSRIYYFKNAKKVYLSSADWMPRNFFSRLEIAFPILEPRIVKFIVEHMIPTYLSDVYKGRMLTSKGTWVKPEPKLGDLSTRSQWVFEQMALSHYSGTPLGEETETPSPK